MVKLNLKEVLGDWYPIVGHVLSLPENSQIGERLARDIHLLQPELHNVFRAFQLTPPDEVKVVILGQDPYPGGHADGLAFSSGIDDIPYSLQVIMRNMEAAGMPRKSPKLDDWARQGVLLINNTLTTIKGTTNAHHTIGWGRIITAVLQHLAETNRPMVWIAWGSFADSRIRTVIHGVTNRVEIFSGFHPATERHGYIFRGGKHFLKANEFLVKHGIKPIQWSDLISTQL